MLLPRRPALARIGSKLSLKQWAAQAPHPHKRKPAQPVQPAQPAQAAQPAAPAKEAEQAANVSIVPEPDGAVLEKPVEHDGPQKSNDESKAEDTETVTTLPKEDSPLFGRDVKLEGAAPAGSCSCAGLW